jgi:hypothetical protein
MKHLAVPSMSVRKPNTPYTCPGLGDRIHTCLLGYQYGRAHGDSATLHITEDKWANRADKPESWMAIFDLFPRGSVDLQPHPVQGLSNAAWLAYVRAEAGYLMAERYYYGDTLHPYEERVGVDISAYLKASPLLPHALSLAPNELADFEADIGIEGIERFATVQWAGGGDPNKDARRIPPGVRSGVEAKCRAQGLHLVTVGAEAAHPLLRTSLAHVGYVMSKAALHIGLDSGPMHLASLYLPYSRLRIYAGPYPSHHVRRWLANGAQEMAA